MKKGTENNVLSMNIVLSSIKTISTNKNIFLLIIFVFFFFLCGYAPPPAPTGPGCWPPPCVPIDGGLSWLLAAGVAYGAKKSWNFGKKNKKEEAED